jgi:hypothetical protein
MTLLVKISLVSGLFFNISHSHTSLFANPTFLQQHDRLCISIWLQNQSSKKEPYLVLFHLCSSEEDFTLVVSINEYILCGDAVGTDRKYVDSRV